MSERKQQMLGYLPDVYAKLIEMQAIAEGGAKSFDQLHKIMDDVLDQLFIDTATWGLKDWEKELDIIPETAEYEPRRKNIKSKLSNVSPSNEHVLEREINRYLKRPTSEVKMIDGEYAFEVIIPATDFITTKKKILDLLERIKPAHLEAVYELFVESDAINLINDTYSYPVSYPLTGEFWGKKGIAQSSANNLKTIDDSYGYKVIYPVTKQGFSQLGTRPVGIKADNYNYKKGYRLCGQFAVEG